MADDISEGRVSAFQRAWQAIDAAVDARNDLAECWTELCATDPFTFDVFPTSSSTGRLDAFVAWPADLRRQSDLAGDRFLQNVRRSMAEALFAVASATIGDDHALDRYAYRPPICDTTAEFERWLMDSNPVGLRADHLHAVWSIQPGGLLEQEDSTFVAGLVRALQQLRALTEGPADRHRLAVWAHSADPAYECSDDGACVSISSTGDGLLERRLSIARLSFADTDLHRIAVNPNVAFDAVFSAAPLPTDPDDNLMTRSALLIALATSFTRGMQQSTLDDAPRRALTFGDRVPVMEAAPWGRVDPASLVGGQSIEHALDGSDLGIGVHEDPSGHIAVLLRLEGGTFARPIPSALPLDSSQEAGPAAEMATRIAANLWGLPDFVFTPAVIRKSRASREVGDCTIIVGSRALAVQVKYRRPAGNNDLDVETQRLTKRIATGARQAAGSIRSLANDDTELVNGRDRRTLVKGSALEWCRVVIVDHPQSPPLVVSPPVDDAPPLVVVLRRDWDFLFDQLRSVSAVVEYIFRVAGEASHTLGAEPTRYYQLARADHDAVMSKSGPHWTDALDVQPFSCPTLPMEPCSSADAAGATVYRLILEDVACSTLDGDEQLRLEVLALLDRYPISQRSLLGRLLLTHLDAAVDSDIESRWGFRSLLLDEGSLQLGFGVCSTYDDLHHGAFRGWAMLRHHESGLRQLERERNDWQTVAVLLTPRHDGGARLWDTTLLALQGELHLSDGELASLRELWNRKAA